MSEAAAEFATFVAKLVQAYPEFRVMRPYLAADQTTLAFECLAHELALTVFHISEPVVVTNKLRWWAEECEHAGAGQARHPLTRRLGRLSAQAPRLVRGLIAQAARFHDAPPATDFAAQLAAVEPIFASVEQLSYAHDADAAANTATVRLRALIHLLRELARLPLADEQAGGAVSMQMLARHQLRRDDLILPGQARDAAVREQLQQIAVALKALQPDLAAARWIVRVRWRCELRRAVPLPTGGDPFPLLWQRLDRVPWAAAWHAWREARRRA